MGKTNPYLLSEEDVTKHIIKKLDILWAKVLYFDALDKLADLYADKKIILKDNQMQRIHEQAWKHQSTIVNQRDELSFLGKLTPEQQNMYDRRILLLEEFTK